MCVGTRTGVITGYNNYNYFSTNLQIHNHVITQTAIVHMYHQVNLRKVLKIAVAVIARPCYNYIANCDFLLTVAWYIIRVQALWNPLVSTVMKW